MTNPKLIDPKLIDELAQRLNQALPPGLQQASTELERNFKAVLQSSLSRLDLVSREQFDVQTQLLSNTRIKLEQLEQQVAELEQQQN